MTPNYPMAYRLVAYFLLVSLFLQSYTPLTDSPVPQEPNPISSSLFLHPGDTAFQSPTHVSTEYTRKKFAENRKKNLLKPDLFTGFFDGIDIDGPRKLRELDRLICAVAYGLDALLIKIPPPAGRSRVVDINPWLCTPFANDAQKIDELAAELMNKLNTAQFFDMLQSLGKSGTPDSIIRDVAKLTLPTMTQEVSPDLQATLGVVLVWMFVVDDVTEKLTGLAKYLSRGQETIGFLADGYVEAYIQGLTSHGSYNDKAPGLVKFLKNFTFTGMLRPFNALLRRASMPKLRGICDAAKLIWFYGAYLREFIDKQYEAQEIPKVVDAIQTLTKDIISQSLHEKEHEVLNAPTTYNEHGERHRFTGGILMAIKLTYAINAVYKKIPTEQISLEKYADNKKFRQLDTLFHSIIWKLNDLVIARDAEKADKDGEENGFSLVLAEYLRAQGKSVPPLDTARKHSAFLKEHMYSAAGLHVMRCFLDAIAQEMMAMQKLATELVKENPEAGGLKLYITNGIRWVLSYAVNNFGMDRYGYYCGPIYEAFKSFDDESNAVEKRLQHYQKSFPAKK
jgi:hypothetical protein